MTSAAAARQPFAQTDRWQPICRPLRSPDCNADKKSVPRSPPVSTVSNWRRAQQVCRRIPAANRITSIEYRPGIKLWSMQLRCGAGTLLPGTCESNLVSLSRPAQSKDRDDLFASKWRRSAIARARRESSFCWCGRAAAAGSSPRAELNPDSLRPSRRRWRPLKKPAFTAGSKKCPLPDIGSRNHPGANRPANATAETKSRKDANNSLKTTDPVLERETVTAHLCEVAHLEEPQEAYRTPTWFSPPKAKRRLTSNRNREFGAELANIVDRAVSRIRRLEASASREFADDALRKVRFEACETLPAHRGANFVARSLLIEARGARPNPAIELEPAAPLARRKTNYVQ